MNRVMLEEIMHRAIDGVEHDADRSGVEEREGGRRRFDREPDPVPIERQRPVHVRHPQDHVR